MIHKFIILSTEMDQTNTIEWEDDDKGYEITKNSKKLVLKPEAAIRWTIAEFCTALITNPTLWKNSENHVNRSFLPRREWLLRSRPCFRNENIILAKIAEFLTDMWPTVIDQSKSDSDFVFLAKLGKVRNWKQVCAICLVDDIMGTTCTCGHTEIVVFRPCGHAICANPCFNDLIKTKNVNLKPETFTMDDGQKFVMPTKLNTNIKDYNINFNCHICRTLVTDTFRAEDVRVNREITQQLTKEFMNTYDTLITDHLKF
jgi:hypothetical protein